MRISEWSSDVCSSDRDAVGLERQRLGSGRLRRHHRDIATALGEHAQDVALDAVIVGDDPVFRFGRGEPAAVEVELAVAPRIRGARADFLRQVHAAEAGELARGFDCLVGVDLAGHQRTVLGTAVAQQAGQLAGVDVRLEENTSELQSLMRISYAVFCLTKKNKQKDDEQHYMSQ